jgi:hypothetical protein
MAKYDDINIAGAHVCVCGRVVVGLLAGNCDPDVVFLIKKFELLQ